MVLTVFAGIAEFERALIYQRTSTGRTAAQERGVKFGRPSKLTLDQIGLGRRLMDEGKSARDIAKMFKVHVATLYRALGEPEPATKTSLQAKADFENQQPESSVLRPNTKQSFSKG